MGCVVDGGLDTAGFVGGGFESADAYSSVKHFSALIWIVVLGAFFV
jgi:hypothetical protein